ncbi:hypothetical protein [Mariniluteicoccus flavus]
MTESFSVAEMRTHQAALEQVDSSTQGLVGKASDTGIGDWQMYGLFASPIVCPILSIGDLAHGHTISELGKVTQAVAEGFKTTADLYEATEKSNVDLGRAIGNEISTMERRSR